MLHVYTCVGMQRVCCVWLVYARQLPSLTCVLLLCLCDVLWFWVTGYVDSMLLLCADAMFVLALLACMFDGLLDGLFDSMAWYAPCLICSMLSTGSVSQHNCLALLSRAAVTRNKCYECVILFVPLLHPGEPLWHKPWLIILIEQRLFFKLCSPCQHSGQTLSITLHDPYCAPAKLWASVPMHKPYVTPGIYRALHSARKPPLSCPVCMLSGRSAAAVLH
jgi:hypothetical protein